MLCPFLRPSPKEHDKIGRRLPLSFDVLGSGVCIYSNKGNIHICLHIFLGIGNLVLGPTLFSAGIASKAFVLFHKGWTL